MAEDNQILKISMSVNRQLFKDAKKVAALMEIPIYQLVSDLLRAKVNDYQKKEKMIF